MLIKIEKNNTCNLLFKHMSYSIINNVKGTKCRHRY